MMNAEEKERETAVNLKLEKLEREKTRIVAMPMCRRERLSLDFPSIDRSRFSLLLLLFSSGCGSALSECAQLLFDDFPMMESRYLGEKNNKRNGAVGWTKKDR
jgi:hypothetical protein